MSWRLTCLLFSVPVVLMGGCRQVIGRPVLCVLDTISHHLPLQFDTDTPAFNVGPGAPGNLHILIQYSNLSFSSLITLN